MYSGHIRQRKSKDGKPHYQIVIEQPPDSTTGKRKRIYETIHGTKKQAEQLMTQKLYELDNQTYIEPQTKTVGEWMDEWYKTYMKNFKSETTLRGYKLQIETYIIPALGNIPLQQLNATQIQKWVNDMKAKSPASGKVLSAKTVRNIFLNLSAAMEQAFKLDMIKRNPCKNVTLPKVEKGKADFYDAEEVEKLIECAKGTDMELFIMLALNLGLRRGELAALRWKHIDMDNDVIHICENRVAGLESVIEKAPKSASGIRDIPISPSLKKFLQKHYKEYLIKKLKYQLKDNEDYVLSQADGKPYMPNSITQKFQKFLKRNNLRHIRLHDVRHTNASIMLSQGISPKVAQQRLGHSDFSVTMNTYSHLMKSVETEAANKLDEALFKAM